MPPVCNPPPAGYPGVLSTRGGSTARRALSVAFSILHPLSSPVVNHGLTSLCTGIPGAATNQYEATFEIVGRFSLIHGLCCHEQEHVLLRRNMAKMKLEFAPSGPRNIFV